jgi:sugar lactone lactonase YvrE
VLVRVASKRRFLVFFVEADGKLQKIFERVEPGQIPLMKGPETVFFDPKGVMYATTLDAKLITLTDFETQEDGITVMATATEVAHLGMGRPLAGAFHPRDGSLYVTDMHLGLLRLKRSESSGFSKVELIASRVLDQDGRWSPLRYVNDVAIGPKTGCVYFTDGTCDTYKHVCVERKSILTTFFHLATDIAPDRAGVNGHWDGMYPAKLDLMRGKRRGRVLMYDPQTDQLSVIAQNLTFANGVAVMDADETNLIVAETMGPALQRLDLTNRQLYPIVGLPGYPDGSDCSWNSGLCYAVLPSAVVPIHRLLNSLPYPIASVFRTLLMTLPRSLAPPVEHYGGIAQFNPMTGTIQRIIQDPTASDIGMLTGVTVKDEKLYLGSLENSFIGVYNLN